jgi:ribosome-binding ATPase YchF (GTP1/OBG family)
MSFCDIPGERGAERKGLSAKALQPIREQDALCLVLRDFKNPAIEDDANALRDLDAFHLECAFADLEIVERRLKRGVKEHATARELAPFELMKNVLEDGRPLRTVPAKELDRGPLKGYGFLSDQPLLVAVNRDEERAAAPLPNDLATRIGALNAGGLVLSASVEAEIARFDAAEQAAFLEDLGLHESALARFIRAAYDLLDLISFFTVGADEVRAWPIRRRSVARQAAGRIHSDLERGFIRAEVIPYAPALTRKFFSRPERSPAV